MAIAIHAQTTVKGNGGTSNTSIVSNALTTTVSNCLLIAFVTGNSAGNSGDVTSMTGAGVNWHKELSCTGVNGGGNGFASVWYSLATGTITAQTVTANWSPSTNGMIVIFAFTGTIITGVDGANGIGASSASGASTGAPSKSLTTTADNSWVWAVFDDWTNNVTPTTPAGQTRQAINNNAGDGDTGWVQSQTNATSSSGTNVTINNTSPTTDVWNGVIIELMAAAGGDTVTQGQNFSVKII